MTPLWTIPYSFNTWANMEKHVLELQIDLSRLGFQPGPLDGYWGSKTQAALNRFQSEYHRPKSTGRPDDYHLVDAALDDCRRRVALLTTGDFEKIFPNAPAEYLEHLNDALVEGCLYGDRKAMFLAQLSHESAGLKYFEEIASGAAYEGRKDLGNTEIGDGMRYKGRGPIQLTGRHNYRRYGTLLNTPLEAIPTVAAQPHIGFRVAVMYWTDKALNSWADAGDYRRITKLINGGYNGLEDRNRRLKRIRNILGE